MDDAIHLDPEFLARQEAGREALRIFECYGEDVGTAVIRGKFTAFTFAFAAIKGWDAALHVVNGLATAGRVPEATQRPNLTVLKGGRNDSIGSIRVDDQCAAGPQETA